MLSLEVNTFCTFSEGESSSFEGEREKKRRNVKKTHNSSRSTRRYVRKHQRQLSPLKAKNLGSARSNCEKKEKEKGKEKGKQVSSMYCCKIASKTMPWIIDCDVDIKSESIFSEKTPSLAPSLAPSLTSFGESSNTSSTRQVNYNKMKSNNASEASIVEYNFSQFNTKFDFSKQDLTASLTPRLTPRLTPSLTPMGITPMEDKKESSLKQGALKRDDAKMAYLSLDNF